MRNKLIFLSFVAIALASCTKNRHCQCIDTETNEELCMERITDYSRSSEETCEMRESDENVSCKVIGLN